MTRHPPWRSVSFCGLCSAPPPGWSVAAPSAARQPPAALPPQRTQIQKRADLEDIFYSKHTATAARMSAGCTIAAALAVATGQARASAGFGVLGVVAELH